MQKIEFSCLFFVHRNNTGQRHRPSKSGRQVTSLSWWEAGCVVWTDNWAESVNLTMKIYAKRQKPASTQVVSYYLHIFTSICIFCSFTDIYMKLFSVCVYKKKMFIYIYIGKHLKVKVILNVFSL